MSRTKVSEWNSSASANTDINGININEGCPPSTLNNMGREIMAQIKDWQSGYTTDSFTVGGNLTVNGTTVLTGNATAPTQTSTDNSTKVATTAYVHSKIGALGTMSTQNANAVAITGGAITTSGALAITGAMTVDGASGTSGQFLTSAGAGNTPTWTTLTAFVSGMIMLWSGSEASIPSGWVLCDGTNSTPDLRNKFVVGASAGTGDTTYPGLSVGATTSTANADAVVVSHTHTGTTSTAGAHSHTANSSTGKTNVDWGDGGGQGRPSGGGASYEPIVIGTHTGHTHPVTISGASGEVSGTNKNLPPYYALCYIMKT